MPAAPRAAEWPPVVPRMCLANERGPDVAGSVFAASLSGAG